MPLKNLPLRISRRLQAIPLVHEPLRRFYCVFFPGIITAIEKVFRQSSQVVVLKIGANDGVTNDQLSGFLKSDKRFRGVLVEPIPLYASILAKNYAHLGRFSIVQAAVTKADGMCQIFYVDETALSSDGSPVPACYRGVASLSRRHVEEHLPLNLRGAIRAQDVESLTVETLLRRHQLGPVNVIPIDTEGADYLILSQFDFSRVRPEIVLYEHKHLSAEDKTAARKLMEKHGYRVKDFEVDSLCVRRQG